jgi:MFS family permease
MFKNSIYGVSIMVTFLTGAAMFGGIFFIPLFAQGVIGSSATTSGTIITPLMVTMMIGSVLSGQLVSRWGRYRAITLTGLVLMLAGSALLLRLGIGSSYGDIVVAMIVMGAGLGLGMMLYTIIVQNAVPQNKLGQVTSGLTLFRQLGGTVGLALMGSFMTARFASNITHDLPLALRRAIPASTLQRIDNPQVVVSPQAQAALQRSFQAKVGPNGQALYQQLQHTIQLALADALHDVFVVVLLVIAGATVTGLFLKEIPLKSAARAEAAEPLLAVEAPAGTALGPQPSSVGSASSGS